MSRLRSTVLVLPALLLAACASTGASGADDEEDSRSSDRYLIPAEAVAEFRRTSQGTAWDVVQRERPRWLRDRYWAGRSVTPAVFVDEIRRGGLRSLREVAAQRVERIRYLPRRDAAVRYGTGYPAGIIMVYTRRD